jgi:methyl-accepting chemotaxis protein
VVADEVRKPAERSRRETRAIAELILQIRSGGRDVVRVVESGTPLASMSKQGASCLRSDQSVG